ncbi:MAG: LLM class flavin-dependent oxidoreductase, partial [Ilumatobacteraceae bacterium]
YIGGMGARDKNFYNGVAQRYGYEEEARRIQDLYLDGHKDEAAAAVPRQLLVDCNLVGSESEVRERLTAYRDAGVTHLSVIPIGPDPVNLVEQLRTLLD